VIFTKLFAGRNGQLYLFILIQILTALLFLASWTVVMWPVWLALVIPCVFAICLAKCWHDGRWWMLIHAVFLPLICVSLFLDFDPVWYLLAFVLSWLLFGRVAANRAPLYLSNRQVLQELQTHLPQDARFLDVGAGSGTVLAWLAKHRPDLVLTGIEQAWLPWWVGRQRLDASVKWIRGDYSSLDFADFDAVYAFLSPAPMAELWLQVKAEMRPGGLFLSNTFIVPGFEPDEVIELGDWKNGKLLVWHI